MSDFDAITVITMREIFLGTPSSGGLPSSSSLSSPPPLPTNTGEQYVGLSNNISSPGNTTPRLVQRDVSLARADDESIAESDLDYSEPSIEVRYFPTDDDSSDEVKVIEHKRSTPTTSSLSEFEKASTTSRQVALKIGDALTNKDAVTLRSLLAVYPSLVNARVPDMNAPPLVIAVQLGHRQLVEDLLAHPGIFLDARDSDHRNAVFVACETGNLELTRLLVRHGANLQSYCKNATPLSAACFGNHPELVSYILTKTPRHLVDFCPPAGNTALIKSVVCANLDAVRQLINYGADPNRRGMSAMTPLHHAAEHGQIAITKLLIRHGAIQSKSTFGYPLDLACRSGCVAMAELLLTVPPASNEWQGCALAAAIEANHPDLLPCLLAHGVSANALLSNKTSALMIAADLGNIEAVDALITRGANTAYLTPAGHSALSKAIEKRRSRNLILMLLAAMPDKIVLDRRLALKLIRRAKRRQDYRIVNELARKQFVDRFGSAYELRILLN